MFDQKRILSYNGFEMHHKIFICCTSKLLFFDNIRLHWPLQNKAALAVECNTFSRLKQRPANPGPRDNCTGPQNYFLGRLTYKMHQPYVMVSTGNLISAVEK